MLAKAEEWAKHSVELHPGYFNCDTYAAVLYKLGKKAEAQAAAEKAIELAKKEGADYGSTQELLEKINAMK
jgi:predicted RNA polymerase sigma factor